VTTASGQRDAQATIAGFTAVFAGDAFRAELDRLVRDRWQADTRRVQTRLLKWHWRRCTFEIAIETGRGDRQLIGKVHEEDRSEVFHAMAALGRAGFGPDDEFSIAQPLAYLPALHVLLEEHVPGRPASDAFADGAPRDRATVAECCGRWLARLHSAGPRVGPVMDLGRKRGRVRVWTAQIESFGEPLANRSQQLRDALEATWPTPVVAVYRAGHGSYIPEHVLLSPGRTAVIDLDEGDVADPARDVAWFVLALQRLALRRHGSLRALDDTIETFLQTYAAAAGEGALARLVFYRALECLHRARNDLVKPSPPARERAEVMLEEGLRLC